MEKNLYKIWSAIFIFFLFLYLLLSLLHKPEILSLPKQLNKAEIIKKNEKLVFEKKQDQWFLDGKKASKFAEFIEFWQRNCRKEEIEDKENILKIKANEKILIKLNDKEEYFFGAVNHASNTHSLRYKNSIYFCAEGLIARAEQDKDYWLDK